MSTAANTPFFFNSTSALSTQNYYQEQTPFHHHKQDVLVIVDSNGLCFFIMVFGLKFWWTLPSLKSITQIMSLLQQPASWYSFPKGQGFLGMNMNPAHVCSFTYFNMLSLMQLIQLGMKVFDMLAFHASNIS